jgi:hypothetical protein
MTKMSGKEIQVYLDDESLNSTLEVLSRVGKIVQSPQVKAALMNWAMRIEIEAKRNCPVKAGTLRDSIYYSLLVETAEELTVKIATGEDIEYAYYLEYGTTTHWVAPKNKKSLHWVDGGIDRFSRGHNVSGIKPMFFFFRAYIATKTDGMELLARAILEATLAAKESSGNEITQG